MIVDWFLGFIMDGLRWVEGGLPHWGFPIETDLMLWKAKAAFSYGLDYGPVDAVMWGMVFWLSMEALYASIGPVVWLYNRIRGA